MEKGKQARFGTYELEIDGDTVVFDIDISGNVITTSAGGRLPTPRPFLGYRVLRDGEISREGVLSHDVTYPGEVSEQFSDEDLIQLYRDHIR